MLWNCSELLILGHVLEDPIFYGQWTNLHDRSQDGPKLVTNDCLVWSPTFIIHVNTNNILCGNTAKQCRLGLFQDSDFGWDLEDSKSTSSRTLCIFGSPRSFQLAGCVRNKLQFRTVQQNQKSFLWMQDWSWMVYPHLNYGIWSSQFFTETRTSIIRVTDTSASSTAMGLWAEAAVTSRWASAHCYTSTSRRQLLVTSAVNPFVVYDFRLCSVKT